MARGISNAFGASNLRRAWGWTLSNPEPAFKNYFRHIYSAFASAEEENLAFLRGRLLSGSYQPSHPCKVYFPKKSGVLRPYSLLSVEDQIVYQALVNVIAEKRCAVAGRRYLKQVFGHLYAGRRSDFFYRKWQVGYAAFGDAIRAAYRDGYRAAASFDLTACYDTIDHNVLRQLLTQMNLDDDFCNYLLGCLETWTADTDLGEDLLYHGHGIPQGPLPSGLLAEVVLSRFDTEMERNGAIRYLRYVDDIRLYAKTERELRHVLVGLDLVSKKTGLFPQSSKIEIHRVKDVEGEVKNVSHPPEPYPVRTGQDQNAVRRRLQELSPRHVIDNETRFKWVLATATPTRPLSRRLLTLLQRYPHLYQCVFQHLKRWKRMPADISQSLLEILVQQDTYPAFSAALLDCTMGRVHPTALDGYLSAAEEFAATADRGGIGYSELRCAACAWLLHYNRLTFDRTMALLGNCNWWCKTYVLGHVKTDLIGAPSTQHMLNELMCDTSVDVSMLAAYRLASEGLSVSPRSRRHLSSAAQVVLKRFGIIRKASSLPCGIRVAMTAMFGSDPFASRSWKSILGKHYRVARQQMIQAAGTVRASSGEWANLADTFVDLFLDALYKHDPSLGNYSLGRPGSVLGDSVGAHGSKRLSAEYPIMSQAFKAIHAKRLESNLSHSYVRNTGRPTHRLRYSEVRQLVARLEDGLAEAAAKW